MTPTPTPTTIKDAILADLWAHIAGLLAIAIGLLADRYLGSNFGATANLMFILGGFAAMGLKLTNGTITATSAAKVLAAQTVGAQTVAAAAAEAAAAAAAAADAAAAAKAAAKAVPTNPTPGPAPLPPGAQP